MQCILVYSDLWTITNGTIVKPVAANDAKLWSQKDEKYLVMIMLSVKTTQLSYVNKCATAVEVWKKTSRSVQTKWPIKES